MKLFKTQQNNLEIHPNKYVEITPHTPEQTIGQRLNQKGNFKKILKQLKMKIQHINTYGMLPKKI